GKEWGKRRKGAGANGRRYGAWILQRQEMIKNTKRVRDILTPQGATPHPHRLLALVANPPPARSPRKRGRTSHPQHPPRRQRFRKQWQKKASAGIFPAPKDGKKQLA